MSELYPEYPKTVNAPLPAVPERLIQRRPKQLQLQVGAYAMAIMNGEVDGLIGSDIFPDESDQVAVKEEM